MGMFTERYRQLAVNAAAEREKYKDHPTLVNLFTAIEDYALLGVREAERVEEMFGHVQS